jgi:hypothetical protein
MSNHRLDRVIRSQRNLIIANLAAVAAFASCLAIAFVGI